LSSFWVSQRRRQIGIRRSLGATAGDILRYFHAENFLIVSGGVVLAFSANLDLMQLYELPRIQFYAPRRCRPPWRFARSDLPPVAADALARRRTGLPDAVISRSETTCAPRGASWR
jgi:hypothetical protein